VLGTGCAWRHLPHDFTVSWSAAHKHFLRWCRAGIWAKVLTAIRGEVRTRSGRRRRVSQIALLLRRLDRSQLFDTL
jgi:transposase